MVSKSNVKISEKCFDSIIVVERLNDFLVLDSNAEEPIEKKFPKLIPLVEAFRNENSEVFRTMLSQQKPPTRKDIRNFQKQFKKVIGKKKEKRDQFYKKVKEMDEKQNLEQVEDVTPEKVQEVVNKIKGINSEKTV